ncbi:hypothetical protein [Chitinivorax sp. B]|uniref:hypothetical protein n=1 Tax=Chitinivorax sp. B TaxID=2502235 RepID=UPI0010F54352|nr:hypothetical protein [Chitinivorax sp. B]
MSEQPTPIPTALTEAQEALIFEVMQEHETQMIDNVERAIDHCVEDIYRELDSHNLLDALPHRPPHEYFAAVVLQHLFHVMANGNRDTAQAIIDNLQKLADGGLG